MDIKKIIQKLGKGDRVKFKGSDKTFYVKSAPSLDQDYVFVTNSEGTATYRKSLKNLIKHNNNDISLTESIRKILREFHSVDEYVAKLNIDYQNNFEERMSYENLDRILGKKDEKKIGNNTVLRRTMDGKIAIKYHYTDIVTVSKLDNITLDTGGWETSTTLGRLNQLVPVSIFKRKGKVYVKAKNGTFDYHDGMVITPNGDVLH